MFFKEVIKKMIGNKKIYKIKYLKKLNRYNRNYIKSFYKLKVYETYTELFNNVSLNNSFDSFYYSLDIYKTYYYDGVILDNLMLDYNKILENSIKDYFYSIKQLDPSSDLYKREKDLIDGMSILIDRELKLETNKEIQNSLLGIKERKANSFKDAIQRILFLNQLLWQTNHKLNGLGRLDLILDKYYKNDIKNKDITKEEAKDLLRELLIVLHKDYYFKSNSLAGDTGQIIILGGLDENNNYFYNDLTYMFIELMEELRTPDPKVLLRISKKTPRKLIEKSLECISTGIGCPLYANDDIIIPKLINYGYSKEDSYNYGTAACWEPYITGKSFDQSNMRSISFIEPLNNLIEKENLDNYKSFNQLLNAYYKYVYSYLKNFKKHEDNKKFAKDALLSLFIDNCINNRKDIAEGGAKYNNFGFTGVGLSNTINSLLTIKKYVYDKKNYKFSTFNEIRKRNYIKEETLLHEIKYADNKYGVDNEEVIELSNNIIIKFSSFFDNKKNPLGGGYKFGLSAPSYITMSQKFPASFDGRKDNEPFGVHISSDKSNGYTELINFAAELDYNDNRINGNVVDFFVAPNFIKDNFEKFTDFIILSIKKGFFEMQMNVISSKELIEAKKSPEKYPNLIVRVWGFSAYFNDLPNEYKDYLIERALKNEGNSK